MLMLVSIDVLKMSQQESIRKFESPCTILVSGATFSGKSTLVKQLLDQADGVFKVPPFKILYCYNIWQEKLFTEIQKGVKNI